MKTEVVSWNYYFQLIDRLIDIISNKAQEKFDLVVGISRGGIIPALFMSETYNIPLDIIVASSYTVDGEHTTLKLGEPSYLCFPDITKKGSILIVDDLCDSGETMQRVVNLYRSKGFENVKTAVLFYKKSSKFDPDYFVAGADDKVWIRFPYEGN